MYLLWFIFVDTVFLLCGADVWDILKVCHFNQREWTSFRLWISASIIWDSLTFESILFLQFCCDKCRLKIALLLGFVWFVKWSSVLIAGNWIYFIVTVHWPLFSDYCIIMLQHAYNEIEWIKMTTSVSP